mgnify:CR=1 FL=1
MSDVVSRGAPPPNPVRAYAVVTAAYWAFMLSDGALRMLVLLHFNGLGFSPIQLAWLFLLYEVAGIVTNLAAGWLAATRGRDGDHRQDEREAGQLHARTLQRLEAP